MNDMLAFLHEVLGVRADRIDGIVFMQGMLMRNQIDSRFMREHRGKMLGNATKRIAQYLTETNAGRSFTLPNCEKRGCRRAAYDDTLRREFAKKFGAVFEANVDVVACNFPTWQCAARGFGPYPPLARFRSHAHFFAPSHMNSTPPHTCVVLVWHRSPDCAKITGSLFMYINIAVVMRYTHRYDHHLQGVPLGSAFQERQLLAMRQGPRPKSAAEEAAYVLHHMASSPNVLVAASNPYDHLYLRWGLGVEAVPWAGLSVRIAAVTRINHRSLGKCDCTVWG
jgi:hypothetical protein